MTGHVVRHEENRLTKKKKPALLEGGRLVISPTRLLSMMTPHQDHRAHDVRGLARNDDERPASLERRELDRIAPQPSHALAHIPIIWMSGDDHGVTLDVAAHPNENGIPGVHQ